MIGGLCHRSFSGWVRDTLSLPTRGDGITGVTWQGHGPHSVAERAWSLRSRSSFSSCCLAWLRTSERICARHPMRKRAANRLFTAYRSIGLNGVLSSPAAFAQPAYYAQVNRLAFNDQRLTARQPRRPARGRHPRLRRSQVQRPLHDGRRVAARLLAPPQDNRWRRPRRAGCAARQPQGGFQVRTWWCTNMCCGKSWGARNRPRRSPRRCRTRSLARLAHATK